MLRHGIRHGAHELALFYGTPSPGNTQAQERFEQNRFTVTRQLRNSRDDTQRALDIGLFINGLPVFTFELKNNLTKQTADDAVWQYRKDRNPREKLFEFGRCIAHFAVDESEVRFCTELKGKASWFLPFNRGWNDGAGNPPNPHGIRTDYLWREVLTRESLTNIIENYAQVVETRDEKTGRRKRAQIWPRYHQIDGVRRLLADAGALGGREALPRPALRRQRQEQLHRVARPPTDRALEGRRPRIRLDHRGHRPAHPRQADPGTPSGSTHRSAPPWVTRSARAICAGSSRPARRSSSRRCRSFPFILDEIGNEQRGRELRHHHRRSPLQPGRPHGRGHVAGPVRNRSRRRGRDLRRPDQPGDGVAKAPAQRKLLRLHRHAEEQDHRDLRRPRPAIGRHGEAPRVPHVHDEAGHSGRLHPGTCSGTTRR